MLQSQMLLGGGETSLIFLAECLPMGDTGGLTLDHLLGNFDKGRAERTRIHVTRHADADLGCRLAP